MGLILFIVFGLVVGLIARATMPGARTVGTVMTIALSIAAAFVGGFFASLFTAQEFGELHIAGVIGGVCGAGGFLFLLGGVVGGRSDMR